MLFSLTSLGAPNGFDMRHAALDLLGSERRAEFEDFQVFRLHHLFESGEIDHPGAGRTMVASGKFHIVHMEAIEAILQRFQVEEMVNEPEVLLDLRVSRVMP